MGFMPCKTMSSPKGSTPDSIETEHIVEGRDEMTRAIMSGGSDELYSGIEGILRVSSRRVLQDERSRNSPTGLPTRGINVVNGQGAIG